MTTIYGDVMDRASRLKWSKMHSLNCNHANRAKIVKYAVTSCAIIFLLNMFVFYDIEELECLETVERVRSGELSVDFGITTNLVKDKDQEVPFPIRPVLNCLDQEDRLLIRTIREKYLQKGTGKPYKFSKDYESILHPLQTEDILDLVFHDKDLYNGFFIEAGAFDSETMSVSLYFEKVYNWTGLLVEANSVDHLHGFNTNRKATYVNTCLGLQSTPHTANFEFVPKIKGTEWNSMAGLSENRVGDGVDVQCLPLYSLIQAAGNPTVNLLILDIEGAELAVLKTLPWDKVDIEIMTVETDLVGETGLSGGSQQEIRDFIMSKGYKFFHHRHNKNYMTGKENNDLFIREDVVKRYNVDQYHNKDKP